MCRRVCSCEFPPMALTVLLPRSTRSTIVPTTRDTATFARSSSLLNQCYNLTDNNTTDEMQTKRGLMNVTILSALVDSITSSHRENESNDLDFAGRLSQQVFNLSTGKSDQITKMATTGYELWIPARMFDMVLGVVFNSLTRSMKNYKTMYTIIFDKDKANIYDVKSTKMSTTRKLILKGWRNCISDTWRIPFVPVACPNDRKVNNEAPSKTDSPLWLTHRRLSTTSTRGKRS